MIRTTAGRGVQAGFLTQLLDSQWAEKQVRKIAIEGTRTRVSLTEFKQMELPKPPLEENLFYIVIFRRDD